MIANFEIFESILEVAEFGVVMVESFEFVGFEEEESVVFGSVVVEFAIVVEFD